MIYLPIKALNSVYLNFCFATSDLIWSICISDVNLMDINVHAGLGLHSPQLGLSVASHSVKGLRPAQEDRVLVTMGSHSLPGFQQPDLLEQYAVRAID